MGRGFRIKKAHKKIDLTLLLSFARKGNRAELGLSQV
jgi:hypothetical protein